MGMIVHDFVIPNDQGGRHAASFKDGRFLRHVVQYPGNVIRFHDTEGGVLYEERALVGLDLAINTIDASTSSFGTPHIVLDVAGFDSNTSDARVVVVTTTYPVQPPEF